MKKLLFYLVWSCTSTFLFSQNYLKNDLIKDLSFLNKAINYGHPKQLVEKKVFDFTKLVATNLPDTITRRDYENTVRKALFELGCVHTSISSWKSKIPSVQNKFFPFDIFQDGNKVFFIKKIDTLINSSISKGDEIVAINGNKTSDILNILEKYHPVDGESKEFGKNVINDNFAKLYHKCIDTSSSFIVEYRTKSGQIMTDKIMGSSKYTIKKQDIPAPKIFEGQKEYLALLNDSIAYLKIYAFKKGYKKFYKEAFDYINSRKLNYLVIDVRDNMGGSRSNANMLISYLCNEKCIVSTIRPKQNLQRFLKGKYKFQFMFSYIYYDLFQIDKRRKIEEGVEFRTQISPKQNRFTKNVFVLVNGYSASSSSLFASYARHHGNATLIGEQTGGGEYFNCGGSYPTLVLPMSKIKIRTATYLMRYDMISNNSNGVIPDIITKYDFNSYLNRDLEIEKVKELILLKK